MAKTKQPNAYILPDGVSEQTKEFMASVLKHLQSCDKLDKIDFGALRLLATNYEIYIRASDALMNEDLVTISDRGNRSPNPLIAIIKQASTTVLAYLTEFGLTLKSRAKLTLAENETTESPLMEFLKGE